MKCVAGLLLLVALNTRPITSCGKVDMKVHVGSGGNHKHQSALNVPGTGATTNDHQSLLAEDEGNKMLNIISCSLLLS